MPQHGGVDASLALVACPLPPAQGDARVLHQAGAFLPLVLPAESLPPAVAARLASTLPGLQPEDRVRWLLAGGAEESAWSVIVALPRPLTAYGRLEAQLAMHAARLLTGRGWPAPEGGVVVVGGPAGMASAARDAMASVREVLAPLPWPRWGGPLAVVVGGGAPWLARPALPEVRLATVPSDMSTARAALAEPLAALVLDLTAPPAAGWPAWLRAGAGAVCAARARDQGPGLRAMHQERRAAGAGAITALLAAPALAESERPLAFAVTAWLLAERRRAALPGFLAVLREGRSAIEALAVAYGADPERLVRER